MLQRIMVSSFKCLTKAELGLTKLNILIGSNGSGKSSIIQALLLIKTMWERNHTPDKALAQLNLGELHDVLFMRDTKGAVKIVTSFDLDDHERNQIVEIAAKDAAFEAFDLSKISYSLQFSEDDAEIEIGCANSIMFGVGKRRRAWGVQTLLSEIAINMDFPYPSFSGRPTRLGPLRAMGEILRERFTNRLHHLGPRRGYLELGSKIPPTRPKCIDSSGENVEGILGFMRDNPDESHIYEKVAYWASEFGFKDITERTINGPMWVSAGKDSELDVGVSRVNIGFGTNQLLSVIVLCFDSRPPSTLMIEQPEIHLHPESQSKLADLLIDVVQYGNQLILETHSEHLLMRLQRYIAEGKISPEDMAVFFVQKTRSGSKVSKLTIERDGRIPEGLPGFFEADFDELLALLKARGES